MLNNDEYKIYLYKGTVRCCRFCSENTKLLQQHILLGNTKGRKNISCKICPNCKMVYMRYDKYDNKLDFYTVINPQDFDNYIQQDKQNQIRVKKEIDEREDFINQIQHEIDKRKIYFSSTWQVYLRKQKTGFIKKIFAIALITKSSGNRKICFILDSRYKIKGSGSLIVTTSWESNWARLILDTYSQGLSDFNYFGDIVHIDMCLILKDDPYKSIEQKKQTEKIKTVSRSIGYEQTVYVYYKLKNKCITGKHHIESVTAKTYNARSALPIDVNVFYCKDCHKYFINYETLQGLISKRIFPCMSFSFEKLDSSQFKEISELRVYGYTVREGEMTENQRHMLLSWIIDTGLLSKAQIIKDLQFKVSYNGKKSGNENAKRKWENDIQFVSQYVKGNSKSIKASFKR